MRLKHNDADASGIVTYLREARLRLRLRFQEACRIVSLPRGTRRGNA